MAERFWTCQRQSSGVPCGTINPKRRRICTACGKPRPASVGRKPAHMMVLDEVAYEDLVRVMGEVCWICGAGPGTRRLHREHDHATGRMRGLACFRCNTTLPRHVTPEWLRAAAVLLERGDWQHPDWTGPLLPRDAV